MRIPLAGVGKAEINIAAVDRGVDSGVGIKVTLWVLIRGGRVFVTNAVAMPDVTVALYKLIVRRD